MLWQGAPSSTERDTPEIRSALRVRFRRAAQFTVPASIPTATLYCVVLWRWADNSALVIWWALIMLQLVTYWPVHFRTEILDDAWQRRVAVAQTAGGVAWGLLAMIAMPDDQQWQMFVAAMTLGIMASNAIFAATLWPLFLAFLVPFTAVTLTGFALNTSGSTRWVTLGLTLYSAGFSAILAAIRRADDFEAAALGVSNGHLAEDLERESEALRIANTDLARVNDQLEHQATHDGLTGLASRLLFVEELESALDADRTGGTVGVLFLDLDRFKFVNDSFGHAVGDALLRAVAQRLGGVVGPGELLARLGGDELVAMVRLDGEDADTVAGRFLAAFDNPFSLTGKLVTVGASVGIAVSDGDCSGTDLLRFADTALLRSKTSGRGRATVFDTAMRLELDRRSQMADELRDAVRGAELTTYLQPIVDLDTGAPVAAEALSRWPHAQGLRSAGAYMDLASELGLEADISIGVIEEVANFKALHDDGPSTPWITVNMPPQQLNRVFDHFAGSPETLASLTLEITERAAVTDLEQARRLLSEARAAGAQVFLDDFGVGQSSLSLLTDLPLDGIKIDAGFVHQVTSSHSARAVIQTITDLGERMGLTVIAEGIETEEQRDLLRRLGVRLAQGYLLSPPMPMRAFPGWCDDARAAVRERDRDINVRHA